MKYNKIILAGGNSYLGGIMATYFSPFAQEIILLSRRPAPDSGNIRTLVWDGVHPGEWSRELEGADLLVNLCGKNVNCRYTPANRAEIIRSRVEPTQLLGQLIAGMSNPPHCWMNMSSATIYRHAEDHGQTEAEGETGHGFSIEVCKQWEHAFFSITTPHTRKIALRTGIVLGRSDGAFPRLLNLARAGMGGSQGDGCQFMSWIHELDLVRSVEWLLDHSDLDGVFNITAPHALPNKDFMRATRKAAGIPFGLPAPQWLLDFGARLIGTETELLLKSRWVEPKRLLQSGFRFHFSEAPHAIHDLLSIRT